MPDLSLTVTRYNELHQCPVSQLSGVGPRLAEKLAKTGVATLQDLLFHLPLRYQDRTRITAIASLTPGQDVVIEGEIISCEVVKGRRRSLVVRLQDSSGTVTLRFFHFNAAQKQLLGSCRLLRCYGEARRGASGIELYHPEYLAFNEAERPALAATLTPVYPTTEGLSQARWRKLIEQLLPRLKSIAPRELLPPESLPPDCCKTTLLDALIYLHNPPADAPLDQLDQGIAPQQRRLAFEELLAHHLSLLRMRLQIQKLPAPVLAPPGEPCRQFLKQLGFTLTAAQQRVAGEIAQDLQQDQPMLRLIQGDVGSGKTAVAALAAMQAVSSQYQVAILAPTEILAEQHLHTFRQWFAALGISIDFLSGRSKGKTRQLVLENLVEGKTQVIIGTHALFQDDVHYHRLGLIVIDEQHRFGVHQRLALREKGVSDRQVPHQLIMTATPIPRTLAMSAYADLDLSIIDELPPGRRPVNTVIIDNGRRQQLIERVRQACQTGRQAYWVCTLIEESEVLQCQAAESCAEELQNSLTDLRIALVHGRKKNDEKAQIMHAFHQGEIDLLIATTVIEVGVNVPNASLMIIENPERLGLAQLHQLRGRVGRGHADSHCVLLYSSPLSKNGRQRLAVLRDSTDGFLIAEKDLQLRGPGEVLGSRQTGLMQFKIADLQRDADLLIAVKRCANSLLKNHPSSIDPLVNRWIFSADKYLHA
jgi:ATP-dependent DNA helicase RecG